MCGVVRGGRGVCVCVCVGGGGVSAVYGCAKVLSMHMSDLYAGRFVSLGHYLQAQGQGHRATDRLEERETEREADVKRRLSARRSSLKRRESPPSSIRPALLGWDGSIGRGVEVCGRGGGRWGEFLRSEVERKWAVPCARSDTILN